MKNLRKTKIVGTIGPASENKLEELFDAGLNVCRINYSFYNIFNIFIKIA